MTHDERNAAESPFSFSREYESRTHRAVCAMIFQAANRVTALHAPLPDEVAELQVSGAFVTLKRDGKLRSCYGRLGEPFRLIAALEQASLGAATKDPRFAPVSSEELPEMHVEVSLLFGIQPITERGLARRETVEVGRHGLVVRTSDPSKCSQSRKRPTPMGAACFHRLPG